MYLGFVINLCIDPLPPEVTHPANLIFHRASIITHKSKKVTQNPHPLFKLINKLRYC